MGLLIREWGKGFYFLQGERFLFPPDASGAFRMHVLRSAVSRNARFVEV